MSKSAGRILLIPKGIWSETENYLMLDMVRHNNAFWVCKKSNVNIEPSEENSEHWTPMVKDSQSQSVSVMTGASSSTDGTEGLVPKPHAGDEDKALLGDGTWGKVDSIYKYETEEEYNTAVENDEIPDGATVIKMWDNVTPTIPIDAELSETSMNAIANKVVAEKIKAVKQDISELNSVLANPIYTLGKVTNDITYDSSNDFNSYVTPGIYAIKENDIIKNMINKPCNVSGILEVIDAVGMANTPLSDPNITYRYLLQIYRTLNGDEYSRLVYRESTDTSAIGTRKWSRNVTSSDDMSFSVNDGILSITYDDGQ